MDRSPEGSGLIFFLFRLLIVQELEQRTVYSERDLTGALFNDFEARSDAHIAQVRGDLLDLTSPFLLRPLVLAGRGRLPR